jgi:hypothetical protein
MDNSARISLKPFYQMYSARDCFSLTNIPPFYLSLKGKILDNRAQAAGYSVTVEHVSVTKFPPNQAKTPDI